MKEKLLFVTKGGTERDNGLNYVIELARTLKSGIEVIMVFPKQLGEVYENIMAAVTFAEAGEHTASRDMMNYHNERILNEAACQAKSIVDRCEGAGIPCSWHATQDDPIVAIRNHVRGMPSIEMVLISPDLYQKRKGLNLRKLMKQITKPIVTISMPEKANV